MASDYFISKQMHSACELCDSTANQLQGFSDKDMKLVLKWAESQIKDPKLALTVREHGPALATKLIQDLYPHETCAYLTDECAKDYGGPGSHIVDFLKEILRNTTRCVECNLCENAILLATVDILPNPNLPGCIIELVKDNVCGLFNQTLPGIGDQGYFLCVELINDFVGDIVSALKTFLHPNLVCGTVLKACTNEYTDNILECVCDNVKLPKYLEWIMPCHWQHDTS